MRCKIVEHDKGKANAVDKQDKQDNDNLLV